MYVCCLQYIFCPEKEHSPSEMSKFLSVFFLFFFWGGGGGIGGGRERGREGGRIHSHIVVFFFLEVVFAPTPALADALTGGHRFSQGINKVCYAKKKKERKKDRRRRRRVS